MNDISRTEKGNHAFAGGLEKCGVTTVFDVKVTEEQRRYAEDMVSRFNFGQRGRGDGNQREQFTGVLGQTVFADLLHADRPNGETGFDGGWDFVINSRRVDIKTMTRTVAMRPDFVHNFIGYQEAYPVDYYVFASYNIKKEILTLCGYVEKNELLQRAEFFPKGSLRTRSDGSTFRNFAPLYEIKQEHLHSPDTLDALTAGIR